MTILVSGSRGQLGQAIVRRLGHSCIPCDRTTLDLRNPQAIRTAVAASKATAVIHCGAYTQVDQAEIEPQECREVNAVATRCLAEACRDLDAVFVYISTDYVFGAERNPNIPWFETDPPSPQSVYARTKLEGEQFASQWQKHFIVRTCGLYGHTPARSNFVEKMIELSRTRERLRVVNDQWCSPTYVEHLADAILFLGRTSEFGTYHVVNDGVVTWYAFASEILRQIGSRTPIDPIRSDEFQARAARPAYSVLDTSKYHALGGPQMPHWQVALTEYLNLRETLNF